MTTTRGGGSSPGLVESLARVLAAADEHVELDARAPQRRQLAGRGDEHARSPGGACSCDVAADEEDAVAARELLPRQRAVLSRRYELAAEHRDRPLALAVDVGERSPLRLGGRGGVDGDAVRGQLLTGAAAQLVFAERRVQVHRAVQLGELDGRDSTAAAGLLPRLESVHDLARRGHVVDAREPDPLHMPYNREPHTSHIRAEVRCTCR